MARQSEYLGELKKAIDLKYQCQATHKETVFVREKTEKDETVWSGYVETFDLAGHPKAGRCYAWQHIESKGIKIFTILENQWIDSPHRAIQAAIFVGAQPTIGEMVNNLELLQKRIEAAKKALYEAEIKAEDLDAIIQASERGQEQRLKRRAA